MPRDNRCMYMAHICFYVWCSDCVGVCGNVCCVAISLDQWDIMLYCIYIYIYMWVCVCMKYELYLLLIDGKET